MVDQTVDQISNENKDDAGASLADIRDIAGDDYQKLLAIEKKVLYSRFYFVGDRPILRRHGKGVDTDKIEYDQIDIEDYDMFGDYDPRYYADYINYAVQNALYKNFIASNDKNVFLTSFKEVTALLDHAIKINSSGAVFKDGVDGDIMVKVYGVLNALNEWKKLDVFASESFGAYTSRHLKNLLNNCPSATLRSIKMVFNDTLGNSISMTGGWCAPESRQDLWAINDSLRYEWTLAQESYNKCKERMWSIIKNAKNLNICSNNVNVQSTAPATITQMASCAQTIGEGSETNNTNTGENGSGDNGTSALSGTDSASDSSSPSTSSSSPDSSFGSGYLSNPATNNIQNNSSNSSGASSNGLSSNGGSGKLNINISGANAPASNNADSDSGDSNMMVYVVILLLFVGIGIAVFAFTRKSSSPKQNPTGADMTNSYGNRYDDLFV